MKTWTLLGSTALSLILVSGAARADVTPEDVWTAWKTMAEGYGQKVTTASEARDGDTLVVSGVDMSMDKDGSKAEGKIDEIRLTDQGDGTVEITMSDSITITMDTPAVDTSKGAKITMTYAMPGMSTIASGDPDAVSYDLTAPDVTVHVEGADAAEPSTGSVVADVAFKEVTGSYGSEQQDAGQQMDSEFAAKSGDVSFTVKSPDGSDVTMKLTASDFAGKTSGLFLGAEAMADMNAALKAGFGFDTSLTYGAATYELNTNAEGQAVKVSGKMDGGSFGASIDHGKFAMNSGSKGVAMTAESAALPIPDLSVSYGEAAFSILVPLEKSDSPSDFALMTKLTDLKISDGIWGMIDPTAALPHDPATLIVDTKGTATLKADLTDPAAMGGMTDAAPGDLNSFDLTQLDLKAAGAEITGTGSLTFDTSDMTSFAGIPAPTGKVDLKATGVNGLIDKLVTMGLVPQDQAMQGKMMMGMFAQPGEGEDTLVSSIEFKDKKMTINGMEMPMQ